MNEALERFEVSRHEWLAAARAKAKSIYNLTNQPITVDEVRLACPPPEDCDPRVMGAIFNRSEWKKVGYKNSYRRLCHNRPIGLFIPR